MPTFCSRDVIYFGGGKFRYEVMEVLGHLAILTSHKTEKVSKAIEVLLEWTHLILANVVVLGINSVCFVSIRFW